MPHVLVFQLFSANNKVILDDQLKKRKFRGKISQKERTERETDQKKKGIEKIRKKKQKKDKKEKEKKKQKKY